MTAGPPDRPLVAVSGSRSLHKRHGDVWAAFLDGCRELRHRTGWTGPFDWLHGDCPKGPDRIISRTLAYPQWRGDRQIIPMPADWDRYGNAAGPIRNRKMAEVADALVAVWDGRSPGTKDCCSAFRIAGHPVVTRTI